MYTVHCTTYIVSRIFYLLYTLFFFFLRIPYICVNDLYRNLNTLMYMKKTNFNEIQ